MSSSTYTVLTKMTFHSRYLPAVRFISSVPCPSFTSNIWLEN